jgi:RNA polymerase sigma factor (sigma-70 family)
MKRDCTAAVARGIERLVEPGTVTGLSEQQVLARFIAGGDAVAFEAIVVRYGPMVLSVCRQVLRDANDVDDAFQATFVTLIQKAAALKEPQQLGPWLYGVAYRVAVRARRRRKLVGLPSDLAGRAGDHGTGDSEQLAAVHEEIQRLPEKYRLPIVLCCIGEQTHDEAARKLNWPIGTVHGRLSRGRELLRGRLGRRGMEIPAMVSSTSLRQPKRRENAVPQTLLISTLALSEGAIPSHLHRLVHGVIAAMFIEKLKSVVLVVIVTAFGAATASTALFAFHSQDEKAAVPAGGPSGEHAGPKQGQARNAFAKAIDPRQGAPSSEVRKVAGYRPAEADGRNENDERAAVEVGKLRAKTDLLELDCESLRGRIRHGVEFIAQLEDSMDRLLPSSTPEQVGELKDSIEKQRTKMEADIKMQRTKMEANIELWRERYLHSRVEMARLKHQIARASKSLDASSDPSDALGEVIRRIDRLEAKLDLLADSIAKGTPR